MRNLRELILGLVCLSFVALADDPVWGNSNTNDANFFSYIAPSLDPSANWNWWNCNDNQSWPLTDAAGGVISCPFITQTTPSVVGFNPADEIVDPSHGWVLYKRQMYVHDVSPTNMFSGVKAFNQGGSWAAPHFVVYNKYTGTLRFFAYVGGLSNVVPGGTVTITLDASDCSKTNDSYSCQGAQNRNDVFQLQAAKLPDYSYLPFVVAFKEQNQQPQNGRWYVFDVQVAYLPEAKTTQINLIANFISTTTSEVKLTGSYSGVVCDNATSANCVVNSNTLTPSSWVSGVVNTANGYVSTTNTVLGGVQKVANVAGNWYQSQAAAMVGYAMPYSANSCSNGCGYYKDRRDLRAFPQYRDAIDMASDMNSLSAFFKSGGAFLGKVQSAFGMISAALPAVNAIAGVFGVFGEAPPKVSFAKGSMDLSGVLRAQSIPATTWNSYAGGGYGLKLGNIPIYAKNNSNPPIGLFSVKKNPIVYIVVNRGAPFYAQKQEFFSGLNGEDLVDPRKLYAVAFFDANGKWTAWAEPGTYYNGVQSNWRKYTWTSSAGWVGQQAATNFPSGAKLVSDEWTIPQRWIFSEPTSEWINDNPARPASAVIDMIGYKSNSIHYQDLTNGLWVKDRNITWQAARFQDGYLRGSGFSAVDPVSGVATSFWGIYSPFEWNTMVETDLDLVSEMRLIRNYQRFEREANVPQSYSISKTIDAEIHVLVLPPNYLQDVPVRSYNTVVAKWLEAKTGKHFRPTTKNDYRPIL